MIHSSIGEKIIGAKADGKIIPLTQPLKNTQIIEVLTSPYSHPTQAHLKAVKTSRAHSRINAWLSANDPTYIDREAQEKRDAEILANTLYSKKVAEEKRKNSKEKKKISEYSGKVRVDGLTNYLVTIAKCCSPVPGESIVGYVSRSRGITVHRADCLTFLRIPDIERRKVRVEWDTSEKKISEKEEKLREERNEKLRQKQIEKNQYKKQR